MSHLLLEGFLCFLGLTLLVLLSSSSLLKQQVHQAHMPQEALKLGAVFCPTKQNPKPHTFGSVSETKLRKTTWVLLLLLLGWNSVERKELGLGPPLVILA